MSNSLTATVQSAVYEKTSSFVGMAYFETPEFYDTFDWPAGAPNMGRPKV